MAHSFVCVCVHFPDLYCSMFLLYTSLLFPCLSHSPSPIYLPSPLLSLTPSLPPSLLSHSLPPSLLSHSLPPSLLSPSLPPSLSPSLPAPNQLPNQLHQLPTTRWRTRHRSISPCSNRDTLSPELATLLNRKSTLDRVTDRH